MNVGSRNPTNIYMFNVRIGFISEIIFPPTIDRFYKTTNGGLNWFNINNEGFVDMYFADSLTGWKSTGLSDSSMKKTTDGGITWIKQQVPYGGQISNSVIIRFENINRDTIWGVGSYLLYPNMQTRGILFRTTNGGNNWLFQVPDTAIQISVYSFINFANKRNGWAYLNSPPLGIHTTNGGDTTFLLGIHQISSEIPKQFQLYQNYPNPFNPVTNIKYQTVNSKYVKLIIYNVQGKEVEILVNEEQSAGTYLVDFSGNSFSSGVYFYALFLNGLLFSTKKMILLK